MSVTGPQPVGAGAAPKIQPPQTQAAGPSAGQPTSAQNTTIHHHQTTHISTFLARLPQDSPLRAFLQQLGALELQHLILNLLTGKDEEDNNSAGKVLAMALMGALLESRDPRSTLYFSSTHTESHNMSIVDIREAVTAYTENQQMPGTAASPSAQSRAVSTPNHIDTTA